MSAFREARSNLALAARAVDAVLRGEAGLEARVGALLVAEGLHNLRAIRRALVGGG